MRIGIDVDDTIADLHTPWVARINAAHGTQFSVHDFKRYDFWLDWGLSAQDAYTHLTPDIYKSVYPFFGALEAVNSIRRMGHSIYYVTACHRDEDVPAKRTWLNDHGFIDAMIPVKGSKAEVSVDWLVDDHIAHVDAFPHNAVLLDRPHNRGLVCKRRRVASLQAFANLIWLEGHSVWYF